MAPCSLALWEGVRERREGIEGIEKWEEVPENSLHFQGWAATHSCTSCALHNSRGHSHVKVTKIFSYWHTFQADGSKVPERGHLSEVSRVG